MAPAINEAASAKALTPNAQPWKWIIEIFKNFILNIADSQDDWMFLLIRIQVLAYIHRWQLLR